MDDNIKTNLNSHTVNNLVFFSILASLGALCLPVHYLLLALNINFRPALLCNVPISGAYDMLI